MADPKQRENSRTTRGKRPSFFRQRRRAILVLLLSVVIVVGTALLLRLFDERLQHKQQAAAAADSPDAYLTATLTAVGDITVDDAIVADARQADGSYDFTNSFLNVAPLLFASDLTVGNLELTFSGEPYGGAAASAPDSLAATLNTLGFDILQTANSKSVAGGISGLENTIDVLRAGGLEPLGTFKTQYAHDNGMAVLREVNGIRLAFVGFTKGFDGMSIPDGSEYCANLLYEDYDSQYGKIDRAQILAALQSAKALNPDVIIAMVHWGSAYKLALSDTQKQIASLMFNNGVDVILGSHSHMVGPMEFSEYELNDGSTKKVFLAYSLGNFLSSDSEAYTQESLILNLTFSKNKETGETTISHAEYVPVYLYDAGETADNRFQILDVYQSIRLYDTSYIGRVDEDAYQALQDTIELLKTNTGCDLDRGPSEE